MATSLTPNQLIQDAVNIAVPIQSMIENGQYLDVYKTIYDLAAAVLALANATYGNNGTTPVSIPNIAIAGTYSAAQTIPTSIGTSTR